MTPNKYLENLLSSQDLSEKQEKDLQAHKKEVTEFLREEFGDDPVIKYAGSREKGTMISDCYDLDIVCYFPSSDERSLKEIREDVANRLAEKYLLNHKASAERILDLKGTDAPSDFHIDVVPGRFIKDTKDVFIHVASGEKERMQTNLKVHIDYIANSGCVPIIRLVKLWSRRNNLRVKTFVLELFVVETLSGYQNKSDLKKSFLKVLEVFKDDFPSTRLIDPANSNNIVSQLVDDSEKKNISQSAENVLESIKDSDEVEDWQSAFGDGDNASGALQNDNATAAVAYAAGSTFIPNRPWGGYDIAE
jgi:hypothetical protein